MTRLIVLAIFKARHARSASTVEAWRRKYEDDPAAAWLDAVSYLLMALPVLMVLSVALASPIYVSQTSNKGLVALGYFIPLLPLLSVFFAELSGRARISKAPLYVVKDDVKKDRYKYHSWNFPGNIRIWLIGDVFAVILASGIAGLLMVSLGPIGG